MDYDLHFSSMPPRRFELRLNMSKRGIEPRFQPPQGCVLSTIRLAQWGLNLKHTKI